MTADETPAPRCGVRYNLDSPNPTAGTRTAPCGLDAGHPGKHGPADGQLAPPSLADPDLDAIRRRHVEATRHGASHAYARASLDDVPALLAELTTLRRLFELQWTRSTEAAARWRAEDPAGRALMMPDLGDLLAWLMTDADQVRTELAATVQRLADAYAAVERRVTQLNEARAEADQLRAHSTTLNAIAYAIARALGRVTDGVDYVGDPKADAEALIRERNEARATVRRAMDAIRDGATTAGAVALAICKVGDGIGPSVFDELDAARAELASIREVEVGRLALQPGDIVTLTTDRHISHREADEMRHRMAEWFPDHDVRIIAGARIAAGGVVPRQDEGPQ